MSRLSINKYLAYKRRKKFLSKQEAVSIILSAGAFDLIRAELCRRSLPYMIKTFWDVITSDKLVWNWHIDYISDELMELARRVGNFEPKKHDLIINVPPGTTKSIMCSVMFPVWCWVNWHWMKFIAVSYSGALSLEHAELCRDLVRSEKFKSLFPDFDIRQDKDTKSNFRIQRKILDPKTGKEIISDGGSRYSTSVGGTLTGYHGHILIVDDPLDPNRAASEVELRNANRWIDQTLSTRKVDKDVSPVILIMQRLHENDCSGHLLSKRSSFGDLKHICLPGEIRNFREQLSPKEVEKYYVDDLFDANRMPWKVLKSLETDLGQYGYSGQIGQKPVPPGGGMFRVEMFKIVDSVSSIVGCGRIIHTVRYWDKAGSSDSGAYTVGVKMSKTSGGIFIIHDVCRGQWASNEREAIIKAKAEQDGKDVHVWVEQEPGSGGKDSANYTIRNLAGFIVKADRPTGDKVRRADPYSVQVNSGNVYLIRGDWNSAFISEHENFPYSKYKDQVDASAGAFNHLLAKRVAGPIV